MDFQAKSVVVTGASRGIGRAAARAFAEEGAKVAVHFNRDLKAAESTLAALPGKGHILVQADLSDPQQARKVVDAAVENAGSLDVVVNNAGLFEEHPLDMVDFEKWLDAWDRTVALNLLGPANVTYWAVRAMLSRGGGRIVNVSSRGAFRGEPDAPAYGASKAGLNSMSQSLARSLAGHNIFVFVVAPGFVDTEMAADMLNGPEGDEIRNQSPLGRVARPEEVAEVIRFLASARADYMTGAIVDINGASYMRS